MVVNIKDNLIKIANMVKECMNFHNFIKLIDMKANFIKIKELGKV